MTRRFTHKGWYWCCPIYLNADAEDLAPEPRHWIFAPLFPLACWLDQTRIFLTSLFVPDYEPMFMFRITGELTCP